MPAAALQIRTSSFRGRDSLCVGLLVADIKRAKKIIACLIDAF